ncbi:hypothetical protein RI367_000543 [Sorochytrium milnesiophthora]
MMSHTAVVLRSISGRRILAQPRVQSLLACRHASSSSSTAVDTNEATTSADETTTDTNWFVSDTSDPSQDPLWLRNMQRIQDSSAVPRSSSSSSSTSSTHYRSPGAAGFTFAHHVTADDIARYLDLEQGLDVCTLDVSATCDFTDTMVFVSGRHTNHMRSMAEGLLQKLKDSNGGGDLGLSIEGEKSDDWMVIDMGSMMVHLFTEEGRAKYRLDELWRGMQAGSRTLDDISRMSPEELLTRVEKLAVLSADEVQAMRQEYYSSREQQARNE